MSLATAQAMGNPNFGQQPGGVAVGHVPQQPNLGLGPNRYVPPTFNWGRGGLDGRQPNYSQMDWNQMQAFYMPQQQNNTFTNPYMQQLQGMLGNFSRQYGGPNRQPVMPQFGSYNPGFGGPTSFYDQMRGGGRGDPYDAYLGYRQNNPDGVDPGFNIDGPGQRAPTLSREQYTQWLRDTESGRYDNMYPTGGDHALPEGYSYNAPEGRGYTMEMPTNGGRWAYGPNGERIEVGGNQRGPGADFFRDLFGGDGGGMQNPEGFVGTMLAPSLEELMGGRPAQPWGRGGFGGRGGYDRRAAYEYARQQPDFDWENYGESMDGPLGGRGGYPVMPQFNPYMLARNNLGGMDFNQMFDPRFAMLFGMGGLGSLRPQGFAATQPQQPPSTANGQKPMMLGGGG